MIIPNKSHGHIPGHRSLPWGKRIESKHPGGSDGCDPREDPPAGRGGPCCRQIPKQIPSTLR